MATPKWEPGKLYPPGSLVIPRAETPSGPVAIVNADFEQGDTGWSKPPGWEIIQNSQSYQGEWFARYRSSGEASLGSSTDYEVVPGQSITLSAYYRAPGEGDGSGGRVVLAWLDENKALIRADAQKSNFHRTGHYNNWRRSSITASAPAGAKYVRPSFSATINNGAFPVDVDAFTWNYAPPVATNLQYKAVQAETGYSDTSEPAWPGVLGQQVVDHEVTWEAVSLSRVVWEARPILVSGTDEPDWPTQPGAMVADGTISWEAVSRRVEDPNCPSGRVTCIVASKVFKADRDIVRFSATANPLDWTTERDAGYLPTGLQQSNANDMAVLNQYRGNLVAFNASSFQMWQVDPDPSVMAILDQMDGIGSSWQGAAKPVGGELFYLSQQGVRTVGIANAAENLAAGDVGTPIDELVQEIIAADIKALSTYYPGAGQYWLAVTEDTPLSELAIAGDLPNGRLGDEVDYPYVATGGLRPYHFRIVSGSLPTGTTMDPDTGRLTGELAAPGPYAWRVQVEDRLGDVAVVDDTCWVGSLKRYTTPPYAVIFKDEAEISFSPTGGSLESIVVYSAATDEVDFSFVPTGGSLYASGVGQADDEVDISLTPAGGTLKDAHNGDTEDELDFAFTPSGGDLRDSPSGTLDASEINMSFAPTGGNLNEA